MSALEVALGFALGFYATWATLRLRSYNPHARLLGRIVEGKFYEGSDWEPCVCVAVSHKGGVAIRRISDPYQRTRWVPASMRERRVRRPKAWG